MNKKLVDLTYALQVVNKIIYIFILAKSVKATNLKLELKKLLLFTLGSF